MQKAVDHGEDGTLAQRAILDYAPQVPFVEPRTARPPGLSPLQGDGPLTVLDGDFAAQMAYREVLVREHRDTVHALLPEAEEAARELLEVVARDALNLPGFSRDGKAWQRPDGGTATVDPERPLLSLATMVAEDYCLMMRGDEPEYRLKGAILCFPARWSLAEKLDRPLTSIHDPVPDYDDTLARRVNRVFEALRPGRGLWRANWLVHPSPEPFLSRREADKARDDDLPDDLERAALYLRTERQTLVRLPRSGAVSFGIKTSICPLEALSPPEAEALARELGRVDAEAVEWRVGGGLYAAARRRRAARA